MARQLENFKPNTQEFQMNHKILVSAAAISFLVGCLPQQEAHVNTQSQMDEEAILTESLVSQIDDASEDFATDIESTGLQKITTDGCEDINAQSSQVHLFFINQILHNSKVLVNGEVLRTYNNSVCSISQTNDSFLREHQLEFQHIYAQAVLKTSSREQRNYLGEDIGGGEQLTKIAGGFELDILGNNLEINRRSGFKHMDVSLSTLEPYVIKGTLRRAGRLVESGQIKIDHNLTQYTAIWTAKNLLWNSDCRCPVQGLLEVDFRGRRVGGASIEFYSCGFATISTDQGDTRTLRLPRCLE